MLVFSFLKAFTGLIQTKALSRMPFLCFVVFDNNGETCVYSSNKTVSTIVFALTVFLCSATEMVQVDCSRPDLVIYHGM